MTTNPKPPLRLAPPAGPLPDDRAAVARALLDRYVPVNNVVRDQAGWIFGFDRASTEQVDELESDPRYLIGRLSQALTALLEREVPPPDATAQLLMEALDDAERYRMDRSRPCPCDDECDRCLPDGRQAAAYHGLAGRLGLIGELPKPSQGLRAVSR